MFRPPERERVKQNELYAKFRITGRETKEKKIINVYLVLLTPVRGTHGFCTSY